jgi:hypothetical protein
VGRSCEHISCKEQSGLIVLSKEFQVFLNFVSFKGGEDDSNVVRIFSLACQLMPPTMSGGDPQR